MLWCFALACLLGIIVVRIYFLLKVVLRGALHRGDNGLESRTVPGMDQITKKAIVNLEKPSLLELTAHLN